MFYAFLQLSRSRLTLSPVQSDCNQTIIIYDMFVGERTKVVCQCLINLKIVVEETSALVKFSDYLKIRDLSVRVPCSNFPPFNLKENILLFYYFCFLFYSSG